MDDAQTLDLVSPGARARITRVAWAQLAPEEAKRLQALGIDEGAEVGLAHRGVFGTRDPIAIMVGRALVAIRRAHAQAIFVTETADPAAADQVPAA